MAKNKRKADSKSTLSAVTGTTQQYLQKNNITLTSNRLRNLAKLNPFVAVAVNKIKQRVVNTRYIIRSRDPHKQTSYENEIRFLEKLLRKPNVQHDSFRTLFSKILEDVLVLDYGVLEIVKNLKGEIVELYQVDGATIRENRDVQGYFLDPAYYQINNLVNDMNFVPIEDSVATFEDGDLVIFQVNPSSRLDEVGMGNSPVKMVANVVLAGIQALLYNITYFDESKVPPAMINLKGVSEDELKAFKNSLESQLDGKAHTNVYTNAEDMVFQLVRPTNQEMQFYELNLWLARTVISAFDLSPQDFGLTMDINRANSEAQQEVTRSGGLATYLDIVAEAVNTDLLDALAEINPNFAEIEFAWDIQDKIDIKTQAEVDKIHIGTGLRSINELRQRDGFDPIEEEKTLEEDVQNNEEVQEKENKEESKEEINRSFTTNKWKKFYK